MRFFSFSASTILAVLCFGCTQPRTQSMSNSGSSTDTPPHAKSVGQLENVADFYGPMPTGVTVSREGRIFVNYPRWGDKVQFTVAELKNGQPVAYPDEQTNQLNPSDSSKSLVAVQSVIVDPANRLWALDTGSISMTPVVSGGAR